MMLTILLAVLGAAFGFALALQQREVRRLKAGSWAQQHINANNTESIRMLEVCTESMGERVASDSERIDALYEELHTLIVVVGHQTYAVGPRQP
jgi:hypothetical protein